MASITGFVPTLVDATKNFNQIQWAIGVIIIVTLWKPIRSLINKWRMHRRMKRYPQLVVCRVEKPSIDASIKGIRRSVRESLSRLTYFLRALFLILLMVPLKILRLTLHTILDVVPDFTAKSSPVISTETSASASPSVESTNTSNDQNDDVSTVIRTPSPVSNNHDSADRTTTNPPSALRKGGSSSSLQTRVGFAEHSNGNLRTEQRYYNPRLQADRSIEKPKQKRKNTPSPDSSSRQPPSSSKAPSQRQKPSSQAVQPAPPIRSYTFPNPPIVRDQSYSVVEYRHSQHINPARPNNAIEQAPFSEQMRKRRLEEGNKPTPSAKRSSLGRVGLGQTRPRVVSTSRAALNKREREEREDRILKDLNTKRIKRKPRHEPPKETVADKSTTAGATPPILFGGGKDDAASNAIVPATAPAFQFNAATPPAAADSTTAAAAPTTTTTAAPADGGAPPAPPPTETKDANKGAPDPSAAFSFSANDTTQAAASAPGTHSSIGAFTLGKPAKSPGAALQAQAPARSGFSFGGGAPTSSATNAPTTAAASGGSNFGGSAPAGPPTFGVDASKQPQQTPPPQVPAFGAPPAPPAAPVFGADPSKSQAPPPKAPTFGAPSALPAAGAGAASGGFSVGSTVGGASARRRAKARAGRRR